MIPYMKNQDISNSLKKYSTTIECVTGLIAIAFLINIMHSMLLVKKTTLLHDHLYWGYPPFHFFAETIINGNYPFWNPFAHCGEPFYPILLSAKLLRPIALLTIYVGQLFTHDLVPEHIICPEEELKELLEKYHIKRRHLPKIFASDPAVKAVGAKPGQVVKIFRHSVVAGKSIAYRLVVRRES